MIAAFNARAFFAVVGGALFALAFVALGAWLSLDGDDESDDADDDGDDGEGLGVHDADSTPLYDFPHLSGPRPPTGRWGER